MTNTENTNIDNAIVNFRNNSNTIDASTISGSPSSYWETDIKLNNHTRTNESRDVILTDVVCDKISYLMGKFTHMEWLAYLVGDKETNTITDIIIPKQRVTVAHVYVDDDNANVPIIGVIHSHHDMGNGFSHTDDEYINANHDISLCVTHSKITGQVRIKEDDGSYSIVNANVIEPGRSFDVEAFEKEIEDNIKEIVFQGVYKPQVVSGSDDVFLDNLPVDNYHDTDYDIVIAGDDIEYFNEIVDIFYSSVKNEETNNGGLSDETKHDLSILLVLIRALGTDEYFELAKKLCYGDQSLIDSFSSFVFNVIDDIDNIALVCRDAGCDIPQEYKEITHQIENFITDYGIGVDK